MSKVQQASDYPIPGVQKEISSIAWCHTQNILAAGSWSKEVRVWNVQAQQSFNNSSVNATPLVNYMHSEPVLTVDISGDGKIFSAGADKQIKCKLLSQPTSADTVVGQHDDTIKKIQYIDQLNVLVSGSWDKTLKYWDLRQKNPAMSINLPERVYCFDSRGEVLVVGTADRNVYIFDIKSPNTPKQTKPSPLSKQTRSLCVFKETDGFAIGSIEGRASIQYFSETDSRKSFTFKCHRVEQTKGTTDIYAVNSLCVHPTYGTLATAGADGTVHIWDKIKKKRLVRLDRDNLTPISPIVDTAFSNDGSMLAYAEAYDWSKGPSGYNPQQQDTIRIHVNQQSEVSGS